MSVHKPVLLKETIEMLNLHEGMVVVDATLGGGGHSRDVIERIGDEGIFIGMDTDIDAIRGFAEFPISNFQFPNNSEIPIFKFQNQILVNDNFANLKKVLEILKIEKADAILADLGWSSDQLTGRGMSFQVDEPLDMRLDRRQTLNAETVVNEYAPAKLAEIIRKFGEEKFYRSIARKIVDSRKNAKIRTTKELSEIIASAVPGRYKYGKLNPSTRTFQAIRMEVNHELENLDKFLYEAIASLKPKGRLAVISFHSLEDRIVKNVFRENARGCICPPNFPRCVCGKVPKVSLITKKPQKPSEEELGKNPRARSAKLRVCEKK